MLLLLFILFIYLFFILLFARPRWVTAIVLTDYSITIIHEGVGRSYGTKAVCKYSELKRHARRFPGGPREQE